MSPQSSVSSTNQNEVSEENEDLIAEHLQSNFMSSIQESICVFILVNPSSGGGAASVLLEGGFNFQQYRNKSGRLVKVLLGDIRQGGSGEKQLLLLMGEVIALKTRLDVAKDNDNYSDDKQNESPTYLLVAGGDGTVMWAISELDKHNIPQDDVVVGVIPFGTGNDLGQTLQTLPTVVQAGETREQMIRRLTEAYISYLPVWFDLWTVQVNLQSNGTFKKIDSTTRQKKIILEPDQTPTTKMNFTLINYFSFGVESRIGVGFDRYRTSSRFWNKTRYAVEGMKKSMFMKTTRVDQLICGLSVLVPLPENSTDNGDDSLSKTGDKQNRRRDKIKIFAKKSLSLRPFKPASKLSNSAVPEVEEDPIDTLLRKSERRPVFHCFGNLKTRVVFPHLFVLFPGKAHERIEQKILLDDEDSKSSSADTIKKEKRFRRRRVSRLSQTQEEAVTRDCVSAEDLPVSLQSSSTGEQIPSTEIDLTRSVENISVETPHIDAESKTKLLYTDSSSEELTATFASCLADFEDVDTTIKIEPVDNRKVEVIREAVRRKSYLIDQSKENNKNENLRVSEKHKKDKIEHSKGDPFISQPPPPDISVPFLKPTVSLIVLNIPSFAGGLELWPNSAGNSGLMTSKTLSLLASSSSRFRRNRVKSETEHQQVADGEVPENKDGVISSDRKQSHELSAPLKVDSPTSSHQSFRLSARVFAESQSAPVPSEVKDVIRSAVQDPGDGVLEFVAFRSTLEMGVANLAKMTGAPASSGSRVHQGAGPFLFPFNEDLPDYVRMYFQIDGEFFIATRPKEVVICHKQKVKLLSLPDGKYSRNMTPCYHILNNNQKQKKDNS